MASRNWLNNKLYSMEAYPVSLYANFVVDSTNGNGLGIRSLKGACIANAFMHTTATPGPGPNGAINPNPAAGVILLELTDKYFKYLAGFSGQVSNIGSTQTSTTQHVAYVITSLGTATRAQWTTAGFPVNFTPTVGAAFIALASAGTIGGSATVAPTATAGSGIDHIEVLGDPNQTMAPIPSSTKGGYLILQCFSGGVVTAPANGSVISLTTYLSNSSVNIAGQ